jgi:hypothetical protein
MRTVRFSDEEILEACREIASRGAYPTYKTLKAAGISCCAARLRDIRDMAVMSGKLRLPQRSRTIASAAHSVLERSHQGSDQDADEIEIPTSFREFMRIERRTFRAWKVKRKIKGGVWTQWAFFFNEVKAKRKRRPSEVPDKWARPPKAILPQGQQARFDFVAG